MCRGLSIVVPGKPQGKKAAGGLAHRYNPSKQAMDKFTAVARPQIPATQKDYRGAVSVSINACFARPAEHFKRNKRGLRKTAPRKHYQKPDSDNIAKFVLDSLSGVAYHDDAQANPLIITKTWISDEDERVEVTLQYDTDN